MARWLACTILVEGPPDGEGGAAPLVEVPALLAEDEIVSIAARRHRNKDWLGVKMRDGDYFVARDLRPAGRLQRALQRLR